MKFRKHKCLFIPTQVLENMARAGVEEARTSILQSEQTRQQRAANLGAPLDSARGISPPGEGPRTVYDSQNQWQQRVAVARNEGGPATPDDDVTNAYKYAGVVSDFFKDVLTRNSYDNLGSDIILNVHLGESYMNAFWDGDELTFGDGDGEIFTSFARSLDVIAHEFGHGVTQFTANLEYQGQSGALNEHFSDVFGTAITQSSEGQSAGDADWLIGNEIMGPKLYGETLRSMKAPGTAYDNALMGTDPQPGHMKDYYDGPADNQGVHINSGIPNRAFYLASMELGTDKALLIWYQALQNLWATAKFNDAYSVIVDSARVLTKTGQVRPGSTQIVRAAFQAVGLPT